MVNGKYILNVDWSNSLGRIEVEPGEDLNARPFTLKVTPLTTGPQRAHARVHHGDSPNLAIIENYLLLKKFSISRLTFIHLFSYDFQY